MFVQGRPAAAAAALALAALAGLTACSNGGDPATLPPLSTTPTTSTTSAPPFDQKTALAQASAVVREYFRLLNQLHHHMDYRSLALLMTEKCSCRRQVEAIRLAATRGQHYIDTAELINVTPAADNPASVEVLAKYNAGAGGLVDASGRHITTSKPQRNVRRLFRVRFSGGRWLIDGIATVR